MPTDVRIDQEWKALADLEEGARVSQMTERFRAVLAMSEADRNVSLEAMIRGEYELAEAPLRDFTYARLRTWIALAEDDREGARTLGQAYDDVFMTLPGEMAMRRASTVQAVASNRMTLAEIDTLFDIIPGLARQLPQQRPVPTAAKAPAEAAPSVVAQRPFWSRLFSLGRGSAATR